jgi:CheY-like chemotaxis protein
MEFMRPQPQIIEFNLSCPSPRAWLVVKGGNREPLVIEMLKTSPNVWSASTTLIPGEYRCRYYCGDEGNVAYYGPARIDGSTDDGMDAVVSIPSSAEPYHSRPVSILLVEDDAPTLVASAKLLRMEGHIVHTADGYQAAIEVAGKERIDLAVCDIRLWDGSGNDLIKELQKLQPLKAIAITGFTLADEVEEYREAGFAAVLPKPLQYSQLQSAVAGFGLMQG